MRAQVLFRLTFVVASEKQQPLVPAAIDIRVLKTSCLDGLDHTHYAGELGTFFEPELGGLRHDDVGAWVGRRRRDGTNGQMVCTNTHCYDNDVSAKESMVNDLAITPWCTVHTRPNWLPERYPHPSTSLHWRRRIGHEVAFHGGFSATQRDPRRSLQPTKECIQKHLYNTVIKLFVPPALRFGRA